VDINPASVTAGTLTCEPDSPPRGTALFFGNVGCSHCQGIFNDLLAIQSRLRDQGLDPRLVFVQLKTFAPTGAEVSSTFPSHTGPVLQDTSAEDMWSIYGAEWYDVKIIDMHGCLAAFFAWPDTENLANEPGKLLEDAWRSAMGQDCPAIPDAGISGGVGP
jgi:hypothetical protein